MGDAIFGDEGGGMQCIGEGDGKALEIHGAAGVASLDIFNTFRSEPCGKVGIGQHDCTGLLGDRYRIAQMIAMAMGQEDMSDTVDGSIAIQSLKGWVPRQERIDEDGCLRGLQTECGMPEPGQLHFAFPSCWRYVFYPNT